jgi:hypothetical protein
MFFPRLMKEFIGICGGFPLSFAVHCSALFKKVILSNNYKPIELSSWILAPISLSFRDIKRSNSTGVTLKLLATVV